MFLYSQPWYSLSLSLSICYSSVLIQALFIHFWYIFKFWNHKAEYILTTFLQINFEIEERYSYGEFEFFLVIKLMLSA